MKGLSGEVVSGLVLAALGAFIVQQALAWDYLTPDGPGAGFFPRWYGAAIVVLSLVVVVRGLRRQTPAPERGPDVSFRRVMVCWAALVGCVLLAKPIGFLASFALLCWFLASVLFARPQRSAIAFALAAALAFWLVFDRALGVALPRGPWGA